MKRMGTLLIALVGLGLSTAALADDAKLKRTWRAKCASCHGADGKADTTKGKEMKITSVLADGFKKKSDAELKKAILDGVKVEKDGVLKEMDPYKDDLSEEQVDQLVAFIRGLQNAK